MTERAISNKAQALTDLAAASHHMPGPAVLNLLAQLLPTMRAVDAWAGFDQVRDKLLDSETARLLGASVMAEAYRQDAIVTAEKLATVEEVVAWDKHTSAVAR